MFDLVEQLKALYGLMFLAAFGWSLWVFVRKRIYRFRRQQAPRRVPAR